MADSDDENVLYVPRGQDLHHQGKGLLGNGVKNVNDIINGPTDNRRLKKTIALCGAFLGLGLAIAVIGPTLQELQHHFHTDLPSVSYIFTGRSIGYVIGSIIGGVTFERFHPILLIAVTLGMSGLGLLITPYCHQLMASVLTISFVGLAMGALDTGANVVCLRMWGKKSAPFMQALHFSFALGAFIAPLLAGPFIEIPTSVATTTPSSALSNSLPGQSFSSEPTISFKPELTNSFTPEHTTSYTLELELTNSSKAEPTNSTTPKPTNSALKPISSSTPKPTNSSSPKPTNSSLSENTNSSTTEPQKSTVEPENSSTAKPTNSSTSKLTNSSSPKPTNSSTAKPTNSSLSENTNSSTTEPQKSTELENPYTTELEDSSKAEPEDSPTAEPEDSSKAEPEDSSKAEPEDSSTAEPEDSSKAEPEDSSKAEPEDSSTAEPEDSSTAEPENSSAGEPEDSSKAEPEDSSTAEPEDSSKAEPEDSSTAEPEDSSTAEPENSSTTEAENFSTAESEMLSTAEFKMQENEENSDRDKGNAVRSSSRRLLGQVGQINNQRIHAAEDIPRGKWMKKHWRSRIILQESNADDNNQAANSSAKVAEKNKGGVTCTKENPPNCTTPEIVSTVKHFQGVYVIIAVFLMLMALVFTYFYCTSPLQMSHTSGPSDEQSMWAMKPSDNNFTNYILGLLFLFYFLYVGAEVGYGGFIYTFAVDAKTLHFQPTNATHLNSVFWGFFALGRGLSICIASLISPFNMLLIDLAGCIVSSMVLSYEADSNAMVLWVGTATLGASMASLFPAGISWLESHAPVTGNMASLLIVGAAFGEMAIPLLLGNLFTSVIGPMSLMYVMLGTSILTAIIFGVTVFLAASEGKSYDPLPKEDILEDIVTSVQSAIDKEDIPNGPKQISKPFLPKPLQVKKHKE